MSRAIVPELHAGQITNEAGDGLWRVFRTEFSSYRLIYAPTAERAMRKVRNASSARPVRPSSYYQCLRAKGLYRFGRKARRK